MPKYITKHNLQWIIPLLALIVSIVGIPWNDTIERFFPTKLWYYIGHYHPDHNRLLTITPAECPDGCSTYPRFIHAEFHRCGDYYCVDEGTILEAAQPPEWVPVNKAYGRTEKGVDAGVKKHLVEPGECIQVKDTELSDAATPPEHIGGYYLWVRAHKISCN